MARICPLKKRQVLYLDCLECELRGEPCKQETEKKKKEKEEENSQKKNN